MENATVVSFIIGVICLFVAIPAVLVGLFVGPHILIPALSCAALGTGLMFYARSRTQR